MNDHIPSGLGAVDRVDSGAGSESVHQASAVPSAVVSVSEAGMTGAHAASEPVAKVFVKDGHWDRGHYIDRKTWHAQPLAALEKLANGTLLYAHPAPAWQPIETAPKDGRWIVCIGHLQNDVPDTVRWLVDGWNDGYTREDSQPTHWMPLPAPPAAATGGKTA